MSVLVRKSRRARLGVESLEVRDVPSGSPATSQVSGLVYIDENLDGHAQDWEWRFAGVQVFLTGSAADGVPGNMIRQNAVTDQGGIYRFTDLPAGGYSIRINPPDGYRPGGHDVGAFGGTPNGATIELLNVPAGQSSGAYNFGLTNGVPIRPPVCPPPVAKSQVSGLVYIDENRDGDAQDWEWRLQGVTVTLTGSDTGGNAVTRTATTDQGGIYWFRDLPAGTYQIRVTTPAGLTPGQSSVGAFGGNPQPNLVTNVVIPAGQVSGAYNFGELKPTPPPCGNPPPAQTSTIGGLVFDDADQSGSFNAGDSPLFGVAVDITGTTTGGQAVNLSTTTGQDGTYSFGNLPAGTYTISVVQPDGFLQGQSFVGAFGGTPAADSVIGIPVPAGQTSVGYDFSFVERLR
jgi:SdrD B-like protein